MVKLNLVGKVFGKLIVKSFDGVDKFGHTRWVCACDCGKEKVIMGDHLVRGNIGSCGCYSGMRTHGMYKSPEICAYSHAKSRCQNSHTEQYEDYGRRGIKFKFNSFEEFFKELGFRPEGKSLDRIDTNGNYEVGNVRWATPREQSFNTRQSIAKLMRIIAWG
jgi:hypothetical protein